MPADKRARRHRREYRLLRVARGFTQALPPSLHPTQRLLLRALLSLSPTHNRRARANLSRAFPSLPPRLHQAILLRMRDHFARLLQEVLLAASPHARTPQVRIIGLTHLQKALAEGRGALLVSAHLGNWELIPLALSQALGHPLPALARRMDNPLVEEEVRRFRRQMGGEIIPNKQAMRQTLKNLAQGLPVFMLIDQNAIAREGLFVPFFGHPACTVSSPAQLHHRHGVPLVPLFIHRTRSNEHVLTILPPRMIPERSRGDLAQLQETTRWCNHHIERAIRRHPGQWLWFHDRWRTQPPPKEKQP